MVRKIVAKDAHGQSGLTGLVVLQARSAVGEKELAGKKRRANKMEGSTAANR
jgi:hypothetical protein